MADEPHSSQGIATGPRAVRAENLGQLIYDKRKREGLTLEQAAEQSGISTATLSRLERLRQPHTGPGNAERRHVPEPDTRTLAAVTRWLGVSVDRVADFPDAPTVSGVPHREGDTTPDIVEAHLRADRNIDEETAGFLNRMFRLAYEQVSKKSLQPDSGGSDKEG
jgi:transcriptional regulator with XRE-family HTH domain